MTSELKSQNDLNTVNLCKVTREKKKLHTHNPSTPLKSDMKRKGDQPSNPHTPCTKRKRVAQLIGKKCLVWCRMNSVRTQALWDSGAQVCVVSEKWKSQNLPDTKI